MPPSRPPIKGGSLGYLQPYFSIYSTYTMLPPSLVRLISTAPFHFVKNLVSKAASHPQPQSLALQVQDVSFLVNAYSTVYGTPVISGGQLSPDAPDLFNKVSWTPPRDLTALA